MQTLRIVQNNILRTSTNRNLFNTECNKTSKQSYFIQCISKQNHFGKMDSITIPYLQINNLKVFILEPPFLNNIKTIL